MGGRSKQPDKFTDAYAFLSDLSLDRLDNYGKYSSSAYQNRDAKSFTENGIPTNPTVLNARAAEEYKNRTGITPAWDLGANNAVAHHKEK
jgi:hypothetical protein